MFASEIEKKLREYLPKDNSSLSKAMRYSMFAGGKRIRPQLCLMAAKTVSDKYRPALAAACATEMIHTFTLIHDDLPAMDDSDLRRGKPSCHKVFGEDIAILAGDALSCLAFDIIARRAPGDKVPALIAELSNATHKVVRGQVLDLEAEGRKISPVKLKELHLNKTAALIEASVRMGALSVGAKKSELKALSEYARYLGLAFQAVDDILDVTSDPKILGKPAQADQKAEKSTYPSIFGLKKARVLAEDYTQRSLEALRPFGKKAEALRTMAEKILRRNK